MENIKDLLKVNKINIQCVIKKNIDTKDNNTILDNNNKNKSSNKNQTKQPKTRRLWPHYILVFG